MKNRKSLIQHKKRKACLCRVKSEALSPTLLQRYEALIAENIQLKAELEREKTTNDNYWKSIVYLRSPDEFKAKALSCPFCKSTDVGLQGSTCDAEWFVMCDCGAMGPTQGSENAAVLAWNKAIRQEEVTEDVAQEESEEDQEPFSGGD